MDGGDDPLRQLEEWGAEASRRQRRAYAGDRLRYRLTSPFRFVRNHSRAVTAGLVIVGIVGAIVVGQAYKEHAKDSGRDADRPLHSTATPFAGTPAQSWTEGEAGFAMPAATAVEGFTQTQVAADLQVVHQALVAGRLDRRLLVDHDPSGFLDLLAPNARADLRAKFDAGELGSYVTVIDPTATLHAQLPRINGGTSFGSRRRAGATVLDVVTNYVVAYPFSTGEVVLAHSETHWWFYRDSDVAKADAGLWPSTVDGYVFNIDCEAFFRGTVAPPSGYDPYAQGDLNDDPDSFYDPGHDLNAPGSGCARPSPEPTASP